MLSKHLNSSSYNKNMKYKFMQEQILQEKKREIMKAKRK